MDAEERFGELITEERQRDGQIMRCANCDIEILWSPTVVQGNTFCCAGCAAGGPCSCDYSQHEYRSTKVSRVMYNKHNLEA